MKTKALFPGSFDPVTLGHLDLIHRTLPLYDELVVGIGVHTGKEPAYSLDQRLQWLAEIFRDQPKVKVESYTGLTVHYCRKIGAGVILRGIRNYADFEFEKSIADMNRRLAPELETLFLPSGPEWTSLSSSMVRDLIKNKADLSGVLPPAVIAGL